MEDDSNEINDNIFYKNVEFSSMIDEFSCKYLSLFSCKNNKELINRLRMLDSETGSVCARKMSKVGGWRCSDCGKTANFILCHQCWSKIKDKHLEHNIMYNSSTNGTCDCGDPNFLDESLFCPEHKGPLTKEKDIQDYINKCFDPVFIQTFEKLTEELIEKIILYIINNNKKTTVFRTNIQNFLELLNVLSYNKGLMHIISKILLKNYKYRTNHYCLLINDNEFKFIKNNEEHECLCPIIRHIMTGWVHNDDGEEDSQYNNNQDILYRFLLNYKLRKTMGVLYFLLYGYFTKNFISDFSELSVQYIFDDVCTTTVNIPGLINFYFESILEIFQYFTNDYISIEAEDCPLVKKLWDYKFSEETNFKIFEKLKNIAKRIYFDNMYLIKPDSAKYLGNNELVYFKLIDILSTIHNINSIIAYYPHKSYYFKESFDSNLINVEFYLLMIFDYYISILNFDNQEMINNIFIYFSNIIINKKYKQLNENEYSFNNTLYRGFNIFLNGYCFHYIKSINSQDINDGFKNAMKIIPNIEKLGEIMINDLFKLLGYMNACGENFLKYYGEFMSFNEIYYYSQKDFILRDFSLLRFFLSNKYFQSYFSVKNILKQCSLENSYNILNNHFLSEDIIPPEKDFLEEEDNYKYMKFNNKILIYIFNIIRDNKSLIWEAGSSYKSLSTSKINNKFIESIIMNDKKNIEEICKNLIINEIVSSENLDDFTKITDAIPSSIKEVLGEENIEQLILSMTNKTLTRNKKAKFSIKDEYLKFLDINSIYDFTNKSNIQKYINNFKKEKVQIYNTYFYPFTKYEINSQKNIENNFFLYQENFDIIFKFTKLLLKNEKYFIFQQFLLSEIINYWNIFFKLCQDYQDAQEYISFININKTKIEILADILINNSLDDNSIKDYISSVVQKITNNELFVNIKILINKSIESSKINIDKINKNHAKEKLKDKFKLKLNKLGKVFKIDSLKKENKIYDSCIYCLKPIEKNNINNMYGKVANIIKDYLYSNAFYQTIQKEYFNYNKKIFEGIKINEIKIKGLNIYSCNHYIHNACFLKLKHTTKIEKCPLCKQNINSFIPCLKQYNNEEFFYLFKGYILSKNTEENKYCISYSQEELDSQKGFQELINNKGSSIQELIKISKLYLFTFIQDIAINDLLDNSILTQKIIENCSTVISNYFDFIGNYSDKNSKIEYFQDLILIIRFLMKSEIMNPDTAFNILIEQLKSINIMDYNNFFRDIFEDNLKVKLSQILFIISILFDYESLKGYELFIMKIFLPLYTIQYYIKYILISNEFKFDIQILLKKFNYTEFSNYIKTDNNIQKVLEYLAQRILLYNSLIRHDNGDYIINNQDLTFDLNNNLDIIGLSYFKLISYEKIIIMLDNIEEKDNDIKIINSFLRLFLSEMKINDFFSDNILNLIKNCITKILDIYISPNLLGSCLPIEYNLINLPSIAIDFQYLYFDIPCAYCKKIGYPSLICLTCGKKMCLKSQKKDIPFIQCINSNPAINHNEKCGGGRSIYISTYNYKIVLVDDDNIYETDIPFYVNKFGEGIEENITPKDIKLNKEEMMNTLNIFINYSWTNNVKRKNIFLNFLNQ